jgi:hypothetical protein
MALLVLSLAVAGTAIDDGSQATTGGGPSGVATTPASPADVTTGVNPIGPGRRRRRAVYVAFETDP